MFAARHFNFIDHINLNLDEAARRQPANSVRFQAHAKNALAIEDIYTHVNLKALEGLGTEASDTVRLRFTVVPVVNAFKGESNWGVIVDPRVTDREKSAITHAASNVRRIFDLLDSYQNVRALIV